MDKTYSHLLTEDKWYQFWENNGYFRPEVNPRGRPFCIILPPPNANADLHLGHAMYVIEDILIRYHRMKGDKTLWLPGADHAGFETQYVFEKKLAKEGKSRFDFDRETLYDLILAFTKENQKNMEAQLKKLGFSLDWTRKKFTLDPEIIKIVYLTFVHLFEKGLVYRGKRLVNYCTHCGTSFSDLEAVTKEIDTYLYFLKYPLKDNSGFLTVATTRPETMLGDTAVAVNPKDKRYKNLIGKTLVLPIVNREIPVIADPLVDIKFGTGAVKVTPSHDENDFEIGKKHNLPSVCVIGFDGKMTKDAGKEFFGLKTAEAREKVISLFKKSGLLEKKVPHKIFVKTCYKCQRILEPLPLSQWFIKIKPLADLAIEKIKNEEIKIIPLRFKKIAIDWLKNFHDWNISRQIVWGIRIPAWQCQNCQKWQVTTGEKPEKCPFCQSQDLIQDKDTFDTWFSSGQWPFATLRASPFKNDFETFFPTSVMETGYDILPWWVVRMIMLSLFETGKIPFLTVYLHGLVRDKYGQKMSKSKGNVINPMEMVKKYGADSLRMSLIFGTAAGTDLSINEDKIRAMRNFCNKIWNAARFVLINHNDNHVENKNLKPNKDDQWILSELKKTVKTVTSQIDSYRFGQALETIYNFFWHKFCDIYIEKVKNRKKEAMPVLLEVLLTSLSLLHPFAPFITEELWSKLSIKDKKPLIISPWPKV